MSVLITVKKKEISKQVCFDLETHSAAECETPNNPHKHVETCQALNLKEPLQWYQCLLSFHFMEKRPSEEEL